MELGITVHPTIGVADTVVRRSVTRSPVDKEARWAALMAGAQAGDGAAYADLLRDCVPFIRMVAVKSGVSSDAVDDVVQDVLLTVHRARHTYDPAYRFTPWLRTVAQRRAIDAMRLTGRRRERELYAPEAFVSHPDPAPSAASAIERTDAGGRLLVAVEGLPAGQREAVELMGLEELTLAEASARTGRTKTALKVNLHRAIKALRRAMSVHD